MSVTSHLDYDDLFEFKMAVKKATISYADFVDLHKDSSSSHMILTELQNNVNY
jgi:hypothetical protein